MTPLPAETACEPLGRGGADELIRMLVPPPPSGWIPPDSRHSHERRPSETHLPGAYRICYILILTESRRLNPVMHFIVVRAFVPVSAAGFNITADRVRA